MLSRNLKRNSKPYKILCATLLAGGILLIAGTSSVGGAKLVSDLIKNYFRKKRFEKEKFLRDLKNLQTRQIINYQELENGQIKITLTKKGGKMALQYDLDNLKLDKNKKWDGKWRMIMFDIPSSKNRARDVLRQKLKSLNFYPIQKSVFLTPYDCERELEFIFSIFEIRQHVLFFEISSFEGEDKLKHYFNL